MVYIQNHPLSIDDIFQLINGNTHFLAIHIHITTDIKNLEEEQLIFRIREYIVLFLDFSDPSTMGSSEPPQYNISIAEAFPMSMEILEYSF